MAQNNDHIYQIFENVMTAMQPAEELGGPECAQYVSLMERIAHEAQRRANRVREQMEIGPHRIVARVTNGAGRSFNVRLVRKGDRYGNNDMLTHDKDEPAVEFWDATYENDPRFTLGRGQFTARYCLGTLTGKDSFYGHDHRRGTHGLDLCGHVPEWKLDGKNVAEAIAAIERALGGAS